MKISCLNVAVCWSKNDDGDGEEKRDGGERNERNFCVFCIIKISQR